MCYLEIKKFGIIHGNSNGEIEQRNGYDRENKIMIGSQKDSGMINVLKCLINTHVSVPCFSKDVLVTSQELG